LDRPTKRILLGSAALVAFMGGVVAPYFVLDFLALTVISLVISEQFLKQAEWPDWFPGRPVVVRSRVASYSRLTKPRRKPLIARRGENPFEEALIGKTDPTALSDMELRRLRTV